MKIEITCRNLKLLTILTRKGLDSFFNTQFTKEIFEYFKEESLVSVTFKDDEAHLLISFLYLFLEPCKGIKGTSF